MLAFLCNLALLLYLDRVCIGKAAPSIRRDLDLSETQMAWVFNAFTLAYCLFEVPTGHWGDRHGGRGVIARIVVWWHVCTALTGAAGGLWSLLAVRFLFGAGEAGAFPNAGGTKTRRPTERLFREHPLLRLSHAPPSRHTSCLATGTGLARFAAVVGQIAE